MMSLSKQILLMGEQHTGKMIDNPKLEIGFIQDNMGIFLGVLAAAASNKIDLIQLIVNIRTQWLESTSNSSTES